ncbi:c-type cytochrome [Moraxella pluranimalium]|uniref:Cytochrome c5 family protein n=1 Tax=Moraxella pluranimalium TaxID=470453 RepID=A0A1T0CK44_9GAMM|nr:c-type cytochrome [Moraxella pluranimalium]OOS22629.1 cytochrome c5 family protein [Moraxella pluranimalium]
MMTMKKAVMLSVATLLAVSTMATQAQDNAAKPAEATAAATTEAAPATDAQAPATDAAAPADAAATDAQPADAAPAPAKPAEEAPKDSPQVAKLVAAYPKLIARIEPVGKVCFSDEEDKCDIKIVSLPPAVEGQARDGDVLYKAICSTCHDAGLIGAPKVGDKGAWAPRIGKGTATLYNSAINGFNAMPARGGADISDDEVKNAVDYMISQSK